MLVWDKQATYYLKQHQGKNIKNISDGTIARYGSVDRNKMISNKAREKSIKTGFSPQEHSTAAANVVVVLYEYSHMIVERPDRKGNTDVTIRYYETAIEFIPSGKCGWAQIMMKMSNIEGNTLYTIELITIKISLTSLMNHSPKMQFERQTLLLNYHQNLRMSIYAKWKAETFQSTKTLQPDQYHIQISI